MGKAQRVRDPIHGLIAFEAKDEIDQLAWRLLNTPEFQRLRRIRQLGFSEMVFPGTTHTRFAHSIGVFSNARSLVEIIHRKSQLESEIRSREARVAALLHDVGHGPFSHAFEHAVKAVAARRGVKARSHEEWGAELITGDTGIRKILNDVDAGLPLSVSAFLKEEEPKDIYTTVVTSQFDADRLDYVRRDRLMSGIQSCNIDFDWLLDSLEVGEITLGGSSDTWVSPCLYLNHKGIRVAEEYLEVRYRLYMMVYFHKTTRGAEKLLGLFLARLGQLADEGGDKAEEIKKSQIGAFLSTAEPSLRSYLALDDNVIWTELSKFASSSDPLVADLADRLINRRLYKCFDLGQYLGDHPDGNKRQQFQREIRNLFRKEISEDPGFLLEDHAKLDLYKDQDYSSQSALKLVLVKSSGDEREPHDIRSSSDVVKARAGQSEIHRYYVRDQETLAKLIAIWEKIR